MINAPIDPAKLASGTAVTPSSVKSALNVIASTAPSAAPAETPSVSGDASGLRSSAWNTTPARARAAPTRAAARTRGSRATKKICASTLSANGIERSKTRLRLIGVLPTSGASSIAASASAPKAAKLTATRRRTSGRPGNRHHGQVAGGGVKTHVGGDPERRVDALDGNRVSRRPVRQDAAVAQQDHFVA